MKKISAFSLIELSIVILIIGILIAGVTQGSRLISAFKLKTAQTLTESSPIAGTKNLVAWFETSSEKSFDNTENDDNAQIQNWYDIDPQNNISDKATNDSGDAANYPVYKKNCMNGLPCLKFNGTSQNFTSTQSNGGVTRELTMFIVFATDASAFERDILSTSGAWVSGSSFRFKQWQTTIDYQIPSSIDVYSPNFIKNAPSIVSLVDYYTAVKSYINGTLGDNTTIASDAQLTKSFSAFGIAPGSTYLGSIGEIVIFDRALKDEERKAIEKYLGQKWGILLSS
ncbi:MAG: prepilin-type N-terminal cleavage/methylation domain-containing protein [Rickettsiales bacterium]|nr:prepilin-type N-terminal cleavage/methylation domain-containing protein [Rickettsiales bacterium]